MRNFVDYYVHFTERVRQINDAAVNAPEELIEQMERQYNKRINEISDFIINNGRGNKLLMLAGPSGSGKTTTAAKFCRSIRQLGVNAVRVSLDDFYLNAGCAPLDENGEPDFEAVEALDVPLMQQCLTDLAVKGGCVMPRFDFERKCRAEDGYEITLGSEDVVIVEGIHALNPVITDCLPDEKLLKVYCSVKQGICEGDRTAIYQHDIRLTRRLVRDSRTRNTTADETLDMWPSVRRGEKLYIRPNKGLANVTINSIHIYELCALAPLAIPQLQQIEEGSENYREAQTLIRKLSKFRPIDTSLIPGDSLIREFIGGSIY